MTETSSDFVNVVHSASAAKKLTLFNRRLQQRTVKLCEDSKPKEVKRYLKTMTKSKFRGDEEIDDKDHGAKIGEIMKKLHLLIKAGKAFSNEAEKSVEELAELRSGKAESNEGSGAYKEKIKHDYQTFLKAREQVNQKIEKTKTTEKPLIEIAPLKDEAFWGTRQQLRSGKVVGDMLGGIDPVFGVLLNPTGGRIGPGDSERLHKVFYKEEQPLAYHAAVHDAFGYLLQYHDVGPGYNYLNTKWTFFRKESPLACQTAGIKFWRKVLKRNPVEKEF